MSSRVILKRTAVVSLLLFAVPGFAQPAYVPEAPEAPSAATERAHPAARVSAEVGMGMATSLTLGMASAIVGGLVGVATCSEGSSGGGLDFSGLCPLGVAAVAGTAGAAVGLPLGVWWGGKMTGGNGSFLGALGGFGASLALGGTAFLLDQKDVGTGLLLAMPLFAAAGYELTDSEPASVSPALGLAAGGASLGLHGRF